MGYKRMVLEALRTGEMRFSDLGKELEMSEPTLTKYLKELQKAKLVEREIDSRKYKLTLEGVSHLRKNDLAERIEAMPGVESKEILIEEFKEIWEDLRSAAKVFELLGVPPSLFPALTTLKGRPVTKYQLQTVPSISVFLFTDAENKEFISKVADAQVPRTFETRIEHLADSFFVEFSNAFAEEKAGKDLVTVT